MQRKYYIEKSQWTDNLSTDCFEFRNTRIEDIDVLNLANDLKKYKNIDIELSIDTCSFTGNAFYHFCNLTNDNNNIKVLCIKGEISDRNVKTLADILRVNSSIKILFFENNKIGDAGAIALSNALVNNTTITHLWLKNCNIKDKGFESICKMIENNNSITSLNLMGNKYDDHKICDQSELLNLALLNNYTLIEYFHCHKNSGDYKLEEISRQMRRNKALADCIQYVEATIDNGILGKLLHGKSIQRNFNDTLRAFNKILKKYHCETQLYFKNRFPAEFNFFLMAFPKITDHIFTYPVIKRLARKTRLLLENENLFPKKEHTDQNAIDSFTPFLKYASERVLLQILNDITRMADRNMTVLLSSRFYHTLMPYLKYYQASCLLQMVEDGDNLKLKKILDGLDPVLMFQPVKRYKSLINDSETEIMSPLQCAFKEKNYHAWNIVLNKIEKNSDLVTKFIRQYYGITKFATIDFLLNAYEAYNAAHYSYLKKEIDDQEMIAKANDIISAQEKLYRHMLNDFCETTYSWNFTGPFINIASYSNALTASPKCQITVTTGTIERRKSYTLTPQKNKWLCGHILYRGNNQTYCFIETKKIDSLSFDIKLDNTKLQEDKAIFSQLWNYRTKQLEKISSLEQSLPMVQYQIYKICLIILAFSNDPASKISEHFDNMDILKHIAFLMLNTDEIKSNLIEDLIKKISTVEEIIENNKFCEQYFSEAFIIKIKNALYDDTSNLLSKWHTIRNIAECPAEKKLFELFATPETRVKIEFCQHIISGTPHKFLDKYKCELNQCKNPDKDNNCVIQ